MLMILSCMRLLDEDAQIRNLEACLSAVKSWKSRNLMLLNSDKTEMLVIGPAPQTPV